MPQGLAHSETMIAKHPDRTSIKGDQLDVLTEFYSPLFNLVIWQRRLSDLLLNTSERILQAQPNLRLAAVVTPEKTLEVLTEALGSSQVSPVFSQDISRLVDIFCCLFDQKQVGLRLTALNNAMCPRFHVDQVQCRLVTTYHGVGTEWLKDSTADRRRLGAGNRGMSDDASGLFSSKQAVQKLRRGDVALLKGELWEKNKGGGIIHRSPKIADFESRLLLTLDLLD
mgnify:FL=1